jgi:hypothetical protein
VRRTRLDSLPFEVARALSAHAAPITAATARELVEAAAGRRVARIDVPITTVDSALKWADRLGFVTCRGRVPFVTELDRGMSTWSTWCRPADSEASDANLSVFLGRALEATVAARDADESGDDDALGALLGFPKCCRLAFCRGLRSRGSEQDPLMWLTWPFTNPATGGGTLNPMARYLGGGLVSHYPCSLNCLESESLAEQNWRLLASVWPPLAQRLMAFEASLAVFVAGAGVVLYKRFRFGSRPTEVCVAEAVGQGEALSRVVSKSRRLAFANDDTVTFYDDTTVLLQVSGVDVRVWIPHDKRQRLTRSPPSRGDATQYSE